MSRLPNLLASIAAVAALLPAVCLANPYQKPPPAVAPGQGGAGAIVPGVIPGSVPLPMPNFGQNMLAAQSVRSKVSVTGFRGDTQALLRVVYASGEQTVFVKSGDTLFIDGVTYKVQLSGGRVQLREGKELVMDVGLGTTRTQSQTSAQGKPRNE